MTQSINDAVLNHIILSYEPIVDRKRQAAATRISVRPAPGKTVSLQDFYTHISSRLTSATTPVLVALQGGGLEKSMMDIKPSQAIWIELPGDKVNELEERQLILAMHRKGFRFSLGGRPSAPLSPDLLPVFNLALIEVSKDRRFRFPPPGADPNIIKKTVTYQPLDNERDRRVGAVPRKIPYAQMGVDSIDTMDKSFSIGARAIIGWPFKDAVKQARSIDAATDYASITGLISMLRKTEDVLEMEPMFQKDATILAELLRYVNSPSFGLAKQVNTFQQAATILGYAKLKRWLHLKLISASKDPNMRPVMFASYRRGLFLEHLISAYKEASMQDEYFMLGVFSLLDKMFDEPFEKLLTRMNVPTRVRDTLVFRKGAYAAHLQLAESVEQGPGADYMAHLSKAGVSLLRCNDAAIHALLAPENYTG
jgi:EAL and modified HD-GYP domain-containing signal transduction protein